MSFQNNRAMVRVEMFDGLINVGVCRCSSYTAFFDHNDGTGTGANSCICAVQTGILDRLHAS